jgi:hypothetical protein
MSQVIRVSVEAAAQDGQPAGPGTPARVGDWPREHAPRSRDPASPPLSRAEPRTPIPSGLPTRETSCLRPPLDGSVGLAQRPRSCPGLPQGLDAVATTPARHPPFPSLVFLFWTWSASSADLPPPHRGFEGLWNLGTDLENAANSFMNPIAFPPEPWDERRINQRLWVTYLSLALALMLNPHS